MTPEVPAPAPGGEPGDGVPEPDAAASAASAGGTGAARRARTERKQVLLRLDPAVHDALARWASDELRSVNAQIDMVLRRALDAEGRLPRGVRPARRPGRPPAE